MTKKNNSKASTLEINKEFLINQGMKSQLVEMLGESQIKELAAFANEHAKAGSLLQMLIQLASMELKNKSGAIHLAVNGIATVAQLKGLEESDIKDLVEAYESSGDAKMTSRLVNKIITDKQQEKMYIKSGGVKGEHHFHSAKEHYYLEI